MRFLLFPWLFFILSFSIFFCIDVVSVSGQCLNDQRSFLLQLKNNLTFSSSISTKLVRWNQSPDCCSWDGVSCDNAGRVTGLDLNSESISGGINNSSVLFALQYLQSLNLANNIFNYTQITSGFDKLTSLTHLNLSNSQFAGQIPIEISLMTRLVTLDLSTFYFRGLPSLKLEDPNLKMFVRNLTKLRELHLDGVNISVQGNEWCEALSSSLPNLRVLSMSNCYLSGPLESSLLKLRHLSVIRLGQNILSTSVPNFLANFTNLTSLHLSSCGLNGTFPPMIFQVPTLQTLDLSNNDLQGSLPDFPQKGSLQTLVLSDSNFSGTLPDSIGNLEMLSRLDLAGCNFSESIPNSMANLTQLVYLDLSSNMFTGPIPWFRMSKNLTQINLSHNDLKGPVSSSHFEGLLNLVNIDLEYNSLKGRIPSSLFALPTLQKIQLSNNQFDGQVVEFPNASLSRLDTLDLSSNKLEGPIPKSVFQLGRLNILSLSSNKFNGTIQLDMIQRLSNLTKLDLSYNNLSINASDGDSTLSSLPKITTLKLASCKLRVFPDLKNQSRLSHLDLSDNQISGQIPNWIWKVSNGSLLHLNLSRNLLLELQEPYLIAHLSVLDLHYNQLHGQIPTPPLSVVYVDYSSNKFNSSIPADIGTYLFFTSFFSLSNNSLTGIIPESICNDSYLQVLDLSNNGLSGTIPECLIRSETLGVLNLQKNNLSGIIPDTFPSNCGLETLDLNGNRLKGQVPESLANCTKLQVLNFGNNQISDSFPCWLKNSSSLRVLVLRSNKFHGSIACQESNSTRGSNSTWPMLQIVDLASNNFSGELPPGCFFKWKAMMPDEDEAQSKFNHLQFEVLKLSRLYYQDAVTVTSKGLEMELVKILTVFTSIDFSCNSFEGKIPEVLGNLKALYVLNLSYNGFIGEIPSSLGNLTQLESLDLSKNNLSGEIPTQLASLNFLSVLNLSFNQLVGRIPTSTQLQSFSNASFEGNKGLCGAPLGEKCTNAGKDPSAMLPAPDKALSSAIQFDWQFIFAGLGFGVGAGIVVGPLMFWKKGRKWYDERTDRLLLMIRPMVGLIYTSCNDGRVEAEEAIEEEPKDVTDDNDEDEQEDKAFRGRFCVYCSKLDISRKLAIHDPKCTCHNSPPITSSSSSSSYSSS